MIWGKELYDLVTAGIVQPAAAEPDGRSVARKWCPCAQVLTAPGGEYAVTLIMPAPLQTTTKSPKPTNRIFTAVVLGLIKPRGLFAAPEGVTTRAEAVTVISRLVKIIDNPTQRVDVSASMAEESGGLKMTLSIENGQRCRHHQSPRSEVNFKLFDGEGITHTWSAYALPWR